MDIKQKKEIVKAVRLGVSKIELIDAYSNLDSVQLKELISFYDVANSAKIAFEENNKTKIQKIYLSDLDTQSLEIIIKEFRNLSHTRKNNVSKNKVNLEIKTKIRFFLKKLNSSFKKIGLIILVLICFILFAIFMIYLISFSGTPINLPIGLNNILV